MNYQLVNRQTWERAEHFDHYLKVPCTYSVTTDIEISAVLKTVKANGGKLYPKLIHLITALVNQHSEFRMSLLEGELVIWETVNPSYTIFHPENDTFSAIWTEYNKDYQRFLANYQEDQRLFSQKLGLFTKPQLPLNHINISSLPWVEFKGFNLTIEANSQYLAPIFTMGRFRQEGAQVWLPLAIQVHHAVIDGFHVSRFINELQAICQSI